MMKMTVRLISEFEEGNKRAIIFLDNKEDCFYVEFYENGSIIGTEQYPNKSINWAEDCAENWVMGIKKVINGD